MELFPWVNQAAESISSAWFFCLNWVECDVARYSEASWTDHDSVGCIIYQNDIQHFFLRLAAHAAGCL